MSEHVPLIHGGEVIAPASRQTRIRRGMKMECDEEELVLYSVETSYDGEEYPRRLTTRAICLPLWKLQYLNTLAEQHDVPIDVLLNEYDAALRQNEWNSRRDTLLNPVTRLEESSDDEESDFTIGEVGGDSTLRP